MKEENFSRSMWLSSLVRYAYSLVFCQTVLILVQSFVSFSLGSHRIRMYVDDEATGESHDDTWEVKTFPLFGTLCPFPEG